MAGTPVQKKLRLQSGHKAMILNAPKAYSTILGTSSVGVDFVSTGEEDLDFVHLFIRNKAELEKYIDVALQAVKYDGLLWISYPKGSSKVETDVNRDILWEMLKAKNIRPVTQISIDETWSALRFRPSDEVGK